MEDFDACDDMDDDWFYESVTRYNILQMFYLQNIPEHIVQLDEFTLCIANRNKNCNTIELLELQLPAKLTMPAEEEARSKENDFKMLSGIYIDKNIRKIDGIKEEKNVITSQFSKKGLQIYNFHCVNESESKQSHQAFAEEWITPNFTINQNEKKVICSKCSHRPLIMYDLNTLRTIREIKQPSKNGLPQNEDMCLHDNVVSKLLDNNTLGVLDSTDGAIELIDLRSGNIYCKLERTEKVDNNEWWILSDYDFNTFTNYFGVLSTKGNLCLYDIRNFNLLIENECFNTVVPNKDKLKLKVTNRERFSISGIDSNIYVYNIVKNNCELAFIHNGHSQKMVRNDSDNLINGHIWLPSIGDNFIVSISQNRSLNCWEYNE